MDRSTLVNYAPAIANSRSRHLSARFDVILLGTSLILALTGVVMIYSATKGKLSLAGEDTHYYLKRQAAYVLIGLAVMIGLALFDYRRLEQISTVLYVGILVALLAVLSPIGSPALGSARWFSFGPLQLQPSEFATLVLIVCIFAEGAISRTGNMLPFKRGMEKIVEGSGVPIIPCIWIACGAASSVSPAANSSGSGLPGYPIP